MIVPEAVWAANTQQPALTGVFVTLADNVPFAQGRAAVDRVARADAAPDVQDRGEYVETFSSQVDVLLAIVYVFLALAILIAFMGIANTLSLSLHERTRELGLLRAVGLTRSQLRATVRWESVIIALFGVIGGVAAGVLVGWGLTAQLRRRHAPGRVLGARGTAGADRPGRSRGRRPGRGAPGAAGGEAPGAHRPGHGLSAA